MKLKNTLIAGTFLSLLSLGSCVNMSTMQTARTTEEGEFGYGVNGGYIQAEQEIGFELEEIKAPILEVTGRYGIKDNWDVGGKLSLIGTSGVDTKYQFYGDRESIFAASAGFGAGYLSITSNEYKNNIFDLTTPIYLSVHPTKWLGLYTTPRYVHRFTNSVNTVSEASSFFGESSLGVSSGIRIGKKVGFLMEYTYSKNLTTNFTRSQIMGGLAFGIN